MSLPPRIQELVSMVGIEAVMQLLQHRLLGREWRIGPTKETEWYRAWSDVLGEGLTDTVHKAWQGRDVIYLANRATQLREEEHRKIVARYDALTADGMASRAAINELVKETGKSDRWLRTIVNRPTPPPVPEDLQLTLPLH